MDEPPPSLAVHFSFGPNAQVELRVSSSIILRFLFLSYIPFFFAYTHAPAPLERGALFSFILAGRPPRWQGDGFHFIELKKGNALLCGPKHGAGGDILQENRRSLVATSLGHFINDGLTGVLPLMYPVFVATYGLSLQTISILTFLQSAFSIVVSPLVGRISDTRGNFAGMITLGLIIFALGTGGYAVSALFSQGTVLVVLLLLFTIMIGIGSSFYHPLGATVLRAKWRAADLGGALGINGSAGSIGRIAMPFAAALLIAGVSLASTGLLAILSVVGSVTVFAILRSVSFTINKQVTREGVLRSLFPPKRLARRLSTLTIVSFTRGLFTGVLPFIPLYLVQVDNYTPLQAGFLYSATLAVGVPSTIVFGILQDRFGARTPLAISNFGGLLSLFLFTTGSNQVLVDTALLFFGFFSYSAFSLLLGMVHGMTEYGEMTSGGSLVWGVGSTGGSAVAPLLVGLLALPSFFGTLTAGFLAAAVVGILSVVLIPLIPAVRGGRQVESVQ